MVFHLFLTCHRNNLEIILIYFDHQAFLFEIFCKRLKEYFGHDLRQIEIRFQIILCYINEECVEFLQKFHSVTGTFLRTTSSEGYRNF